jgi:hypothetical protein
VTTRQRQAVAAQQPPLLTGPPEALPCQNLSEFLAVHGKVSAGQRPAARFVTAAVVPFVTALVTAAAEGGHPPHLEGMSGEDLFAAGDLLDELYARSRMYPPGIGLLQQVRREYWQRVEVVPPAVREPGAQRERRPPTARLKLAPDPVFRLDPGTMPLPADDLVGRLRRMADAAEAAARFMRSLAAGVADGSGEADTRALDAAGRAAVAALLRAGGEAQGQPGTAALPQCLAACEAWRSEAFQR